MRTVELFCGTKSFSKVAKERGHNTFTVDNRLATEADVIADLSKPFPDSVWEAIYTADVVWMSPPCTAFSVASGGRHFGADRKPRSDTALQSLLILSRCKRVAQFCRRKGIIYIIENPRARMRWFMPADDTRKTAWYCRYGDKRPKPTDFWTNLIEWEPKACKNGNYDCHAPNPRGSTNGTQGLTLNEKFAIPPSLILEVVQLCENRHR